MRAWMIWTAVALACFGAWAVIGKFPTDGLSPSQGQALSTIGMLPVIAALALRERARLGTNRRGALLAIAGGILTCLGNIAYFDVLTREKAAVVVPLTALYPIITVALAVALLKEKLNRIQKTGVILSLAAIYFFNVPSESGFISPWLIWAAAPTALWGVSGLLQKIATNHVSGEVSAFWFLIAFVPVGAFLMPPLGQLTGSAWGLMFLLGFTLAFGNMALLAAFARGGKASIITPVAGLYPLVSIPAAIALFHESIGRREVTGIALALLGVAALSMESQANEINR